MRIWLNPDKLRSFRMSAADVLARVRGQNVQFATGSLGAQPAVEGQQIVAAGDRPKRSSAPRRNSRTSFCVPSPMAPACG